MVGGKSQSSSLPPVRPPLTGANTVRILNSKFKSQIPVALNSRTKLVDRATAIDSSVTGNFKSVGVLGPIPNKNLLLADFGPPPSFCSRCLSSALSAVLLNAAGVV